MMQNIDLLLNILKEIDAGRKIKASQVPARTRTILNNLVDDDRLKFKDGFYKKA